MFLDCSYFITILKPVFAISCVNWFKCGLSRLSDVSVCCQFACFVIIGHFRGYSCNSYIDLEAVSLGLFLNCSLGLAKSEARVLIKFSYRK